MQGQLFTQYFLTDGIRSTTEWTASAAHSTPFNTFRDGVRRLLDGFSRYDQPNEAETEQELIRPLLELLGWADYLPQQGTTRNEDIPDHLLFVDAESKARAATRRRPADRFLDAAVVAESKRFGRQLDAREASGRARTGTPHGQMLRYLRTADSVTDGRLRWGILTDGGVWRIYDQRARPRSSGYFEADLAELIVDDGDGLRTFYLLFRRQSFVVQPGYTATFLETALAEGRRYEQQVAQDLSSVVFERAFPRLVEALAGAGGADLAEVRQAALILLYRLLFVLYAEDRGLLPVNDSRYDDYGLRKRVRDDIARRMAEGDTFSDRAANYYDRVMTLGRQIDAGDDSIGLPPYNGGLFASDAAPLLESARLSDAAFAPIVYDLSHAEIDNRRQFVNYRDMSVQQLGSIYERLLEREPVRNSRGEIETRPNPYARKDSGSFYTPQELVDLILDQTLKPLAEERLKAFEDQARELASDRRPKHQRRDDLRRLDPAEAVLELKVLDPAMGSGHFLVTAVDFLADYIADLIEYVPAVPEWLDGDDAYESPLVERVAAIRRDLLQRARDANWVMDDSQLSDQIIIRRMVLKRCIYGVDKNPLTVELAKVSLWLHSFTVGAPLSFLDHHLRCGDSLLGLRVLEAHQDFERLGGLSASNAIQGAENATDGMHLIERLSDADVAEVRQSAGLFKDVEQATANLRGVLDFLGGLRWETAGLKKRALANVEGAVVEALGRESSIAFDLLARGPDAAGGSIERDSGWVEFADCWTQSRSIADRESFLHWEVAFPGVWRHWQSFRPEGGFDAVIGNPPWDRIKLQEVEWFATRDPAIARAPTAAARKAAIKELRDQSGLAPSPLESDSLSPGERAGVRGDPAANLVAAYDAAKQRAESLARVIRASGQYPLLGGGDINLYSLFVERAMGLVKPDGFVGLLTPSGIYADKTAARFFKTVSTGGRVGGLFDFENRRLGTDLPPFFPISIRVVQVLRAHLRRRQAHVRRVQMRLLPARHRDHQRPRPLLRAGAGGLRAGEPQHRHRPRLPHPPRRRDHPPHLRPATPCWWTAQGATSAAPGRFKYRAHVRHDQRLPPVPHRGAARGRRVLSGAGQPLEAGCRDVCAAVRGQDGASVRPPRRQRGGQPGEPAPTRPASRRSLRHEEHADPDWLPTPQFWVSEAKRGRLQACRESGWVVAHSSDITAATNVRTMIAVSHSSSSDVATIRDPAASAGAEEGMFDASNAACLVSCL